MKVNRDNKKYITEEYHENGNIKARKVIEVKRDSKTKNVTKTDRNEEYSLKVNQETESKCKG